MSQLTVIISPTGHVTIDVDGSGGAGDLEARLQIRLPVGVDRPGADPRAVHLGGCRSGGEGQEHTEQDERAAGAGHGGTPGNDGMRALD